MEELRKEGYEAIFIAMRLPYNTQKEEEAQSALKLINPDKIVNTNIGAGTDGIFNSVVSGLYESGFKKKKGFALLISQKAM